MNCLVVRPEFLREELEQKKKIQNLFGSNICMWMSLEVQDFLVFPYPKVLVILLPYIIEIAIVL